MRKYVLFLLLLLTLDILAQSNQSLVKKVVALLNSVIQENDETNDCIAIMDVSTGKLVASIGNIEEAIHSHCIVGLYGIGTDKGD